MRSKRVTRVSHSPNQITLFYALSNRYLNGARLKVNKSYINIFIIFDYNEITRYCLYIILPRIKVVGVFIGIS